MSEKVKHLTKLKSLDGQAVTFPLELALQRLDGTSASITFTCQAFGKRHWSKIKQRHIDTLEAREKELRDEYGSNSLGGLNAPLDVLLTQSLHYQTAVVMEFVTGWSLSNDLNAANLEDLEDRFGDTLDKLIKAYDQAIYRGQLGN